MIDAAALASETGTSIEQAENRIRRYERTFLSMKPWLPASDVNNFLDIGCGLGLIAAHVAQHYPGATAHLIDGEEWQEKWTGYKDAGRPWADVKLALQLFAKHFPGSAVRAHTPDPLGPTIGPCEVIYSNASWGHHYPIETYLELVLRSLKPGGTLIIDLRIGHVGEHGRAVLAKHFEHVTNIEAAGKKFDRTVWHA